jgi:tetratricopeptide (TPR) repeat protein
MVIMLFFIMNACRQPESDQVRHDISANLEFPGLLKNKLPKETEAFSELNKDSLRISFLFHLALEKPVYQSIIYRHLINHTNDSTNFRYNLYAHRMMARMFSKSNTIDSVVYYCKQGIKKCEHDVRYSYHLSEFYRDLGNLYSNFSRNSEAILNFDKAIQVASTSGTTENLFRYITETGRVYMGMNEIRKARECYEKGLAYSEKYNNPSLLVFSLNSLGDICRRQKEYEQSIRYHQRANQVNESRFGVPHEQWACTSLGKTYSLLNRFDSARKYFNIALKIASAQGSKDIVTQVYLNLSICDKKQKQMNRAIEYGLRSLEIGEKIPSLDVKVAVMENLYMLYKETGQYAKALVFLENLKTLEDSLDNKENIRKFAEAEFKSKEDRLLHKMEQEQQHFRQEQENREMEAKRQRVIIISVTLVALILVAFVFYVFRSLQQIRIKNRIIEEKQKEILQSINYARRIQNSLLPHEKYIDRVLKRSDPDNKS